MYGVKSILPLKLEAVQRRKEDLKSINAELEKEAKKIIGCVENLKSITTNDPYYFDEVENEIAFMKISFRRIELLKKLEKQHGMG
jgi:hypothetical protein